MYISAPAPREQHHRPCINVLFRSAALAYGERVVGTVLTGELDDGTAGLWEVKRRGGIAVVQNPEQAAFPSMALSALREIEADYVAELGEIGALFLQLAAGEEKRKRTEIEGMEVDSQITDLTCPDCRGTIWEVRRGKAKEYRCRVGHTFSTRTMFSEQSATQEEGIYSAIVALEEGASLASRIADEFEPAVGERLRAEAKEREAQAEAIRQILKQRASFSLD